MSSSSSVSACIYEIFNDLLRNVINPKFASLYLLLTTDQALVMANNYSAITLQIAEERNLSSHLERSSWFVQPLQMVLSDVLFMPRVSYISSSCSSSSFVRGHEFEINISEIFVTWRHVYFTLPASERNHFSFGSGDRNRKTRCS